MPWFSYLPTLNATLNASSGTLLLLGFLFIRRKNVAAHKACMLAAFTFSLLFLASYVVYHAKAGSTPFLGRGWIRPAYFGMLVTHIVLAAAILPLAITTIRRALLGRIEDHRRIARKTLPLWLYVSATGILIYVLLYHVYRSS